MKQSLNSTTLLALMLLPFWFRRLNQWAKVVRSKGGNSRCGAMANKPFKSCLVTALRITQFDTGASRLPHRLSVSI
jgi:hypothetical protein